mmetsp:Transcript_8348/g.19866  ORF Transcript_8348/g.19866 Transcript_8348/m.19866 type:complete len:299 (-) Transcript_8348:2237-3133(-)
MDVPVAYGGHRGEGPIERGNVLVPLLPFLDVDFGPPVGRILIGVTVQKPSHALSDMHILVSGHEEPEAAHEVGHHRELRAKVDTPQRQRGQVQDVLDPLYELAHLQHPRQLEQPNQPHHADHLQRPRLGATLARNRLHKPVHRHCGQQVKGEPSPQVSSRDMPKDRVYCAICVRERGPETQDHIDGEDDVHQDLKHCGQGIGIDVEGDPPGDDEDTVDDESTHQDVPSQLPTIARGDDVPLQEAVLRLLCHLNLAGWSQPSGGKKDGVGAVPGGLGSRGGKAGQRLEVAQPLAVPRGR